MTDQNLLENLKLALSKVVTGTSVRVIQKDGRRVEYNPANETSLRSEIKSLESKLGLGGRRGPAGLI